jgi:hypothetical protein
VCASCGQLSPCPSARHAVEVRRAAGLSAADGPGGAPAAGPASVGGPGPAAFSAPIPAPVNGPGPAAFGGPAAPASSFAGPQPLSAVLSGGAPVGLSKVPSTDD